MDLSVIHDLIRAENEIKSNTIKQFSEIFEHSLCDFNAKVDTRETPDVMGKGEMTYMYTYDPNGPEVKCSFGSDDETHCRAEGYSASKDMTPSASPPPPPPPPPCPFPTAPQADLLSTELGSAAAPPHLHVHIAVHL